MRDTVDMVKAGTSVFEFSRTAPIVEGLLEMSRFVTGCAADLLVGGFGLRAIGSTLPIVDGHGGAMDYHGTETIFDPVLAGLGLTLTRDGQRVGGGFEPLTALAALFFRLGLLGRGLDLVFEHLTPRSSFGQKVLKHQLVRSDFSRAHGVMRQLLGEALFVAGKVDALEAVARPRAWILSTHRELSLQSGAISKLMGGHGYLVSGVEALDYLSNLSRTIYAPPGNAVRQAAGERSSATVIPVGVAADFAR